MKPKIRIGILGLGTVGGGVVNILAKNKSQIKKRIGVDIEITIAAVKDKNSFRICDDNDLGILTEDAFAIVNSDIDIVLELIGGTTIAKDLVEQALNNGKHVVTANKALIAIYGNQLLKIAKNNNVQLLFEAAVAGGVPIIKALKEGLSANKIELIAGIINGTSNFILTEMRDKDRVFAEVLKEAQELGYAEADPTFDIEGIDSAHKLTILTSIAFGNNLAFDKVITQGISKIDAEDVNYATELGFNIKHLALAKKIDNKVQMQVMPTLLPKSALIAGVDGVMNAVLVRGNAVGNTLYYGAGAGSDATASSVIADIIDIILHRFSDDILGWQQLNDIEFKNNDDISSEFYIRIIADDKAGVLAIITKILSDFSISIEKMVQKQVDKNNYAHIAMITNEVTTKNLNLAINKIKQQEFIKGKIVTMHTQNLN